MLKDLIDTLRRLPGETEWVEFKLNHESPQEIGEYISALSNSACLSEKDYSYLIFGIEDGTHIAKGTTYPGAKEKIGNEEIENWLRIHLDPKIDFKIEEFNYNDCRLVIFTIDAAKQRPISFNNIEYIRVGSYKKKLKDHPEKAAKIWEKCSGKVFENEPAIKDLSPDDVLKLLSYPTYFDSMGLSLPSDKTGILEKLEEEKLITKENNIFHITNLGAILYAKELNRFDRLGRKSIRVIQYKGKNKLQTIKESIFTKGYASSFDEVIKYINDQLPTNEEIGRAFRKEVKMYPELAIRELVANALVHQDFRETGTGPVVEIYEDRIEISNPGKPLIPTFRFIDHSPKSRNEKLAYFMRRINMCEERGSGIDKVVFQCELYQLPAPIFMEEDTYIKAILFAYKSLKQMDKEDKIRACYQHCCLKYVSNEFMSNQSFRERLGIEEKNYAIVSRIISDTLEKKYIKYEDPNNKSNKYMRYIPIWA